MTLLEEALKIRGRNNYREPASKEEIELAMAYLEGRVSKKQCCLALGVPNHISNFCKFLVRAIETNQNLLGKTKKD